MAFARYEQIPNLGDDDDDLAVTLVMREASSGVQPIGIERRGDLPSVRNVFLNPPRANDPPPPWVKRPKQANPRNARTRQLRRRPRPKRSDHALLVHVTIALAAGILFGLAYDVRTRRQVAADAGQGATTALRYTVKTVRSFANGAISSARRTLPAASDHDR